MGLKRPFNLSFVNYNQLQFRGRKNKNEVQYFLLHL